MNYQKKLIKFIQLKNEIIEKETGIKYIEQEDIDNIKKWDDIICKKIYINLTNSIINLRESGLSEDTCIWCIKNYLNRIYDCDNCEYKIKHGLCDENESTYQKYAIDNVIKLLSNKVYQHMLKEIKDI